MFILILILFIIIFIKIEFELDFYYNFLFFLFKFKINENLIVFLFLLILIFYVVIKFSKYYINFYLLYFYFYILIFLFLFFIVLIIISINIIILFFSWDILGFIRFLLVLYYSRFEVLSISIQTLFRNRLGDFFLLYILSLRFWFLGELDFFFLSIILLIIIITSFTKRAQFPFLGWLPKAIAAPTPVRALVHRRTLVTAGVFLLINYNFIIKENLIYFLFFGGLIRIFISSIVSLIEIDFKKLIAWRTLSQIRICFIFFRINFVFFCFFHLLIHAIFKRILFIQIGFLLKEIINEQDSRFFNIKLKSKILILNLTLSFFSLIAIIFLSGIIRKDLIIEIFFDLKNGLYFLLILILSLFFTFLYSLKIIKFLLKNLNNFLNNKNINFNFVFFNYLIIIFRLFFRNFILKNFFILNLNFISDFIVWILFIFYPLFLSFINKLIKNYFFRKIFLINEFLIFYKSFFFRNFNFEFLLLKIINNLIINILNTHLKLLKFRNILFFFIIFLLFLL